MGRLLFAILVTVAFFVLQLQCQPYKRDVDDHLASAGQLVVLCSLIAAVGIKVADEYSHETGDESIGLTPFQFSLVVLVFTFGILVLVYAASPHAASALARIARPAARAVPQS